MNISVNSNSRSKGDADIGLLVACKVQLSSEVIKWKTENLRLVKELDKALDHTDNLEGTVTKLVDRTKELEEKLAIAVKNNMLLQHRNAAMSQEKNVQRPSSVFDKYHSFPSSMDRSRLSREGWRESSSQPVEDYMQVSQTLLNRMKLEMQQFREMGCQYQLKNDKELENSASKADCSSEECCIEDVEKDVTDLISKTQSIKQYLFNQRRKLQTMFSAISAVEKRQVSTDYRDIPLPSHVTNLSSRSNDSVADPGETVSIPSARSSKQPVQRDITPGGNVATPSALSELSKGFDSAQCQSDETGIVGLKICPICEESFNHKSQIVFEEHVMNHLETESVSILDQYVVL